jgi:hypothetical protein
MNKNEDGRFKYQDAAPTVTAIPKSIPVRATTSSIVIRPVRSDDAAGALNASSKLSSTLV